MESSPHVIEVIHLGIEWTALVIEVLAIAVIVAGVIVVALTRGTVRCVFRLKQHGAFKVTSNMIDR
jgi:hypothetical protein